MDHDTVGLMLGSGTDSNSVILWLAIGLMLLVAVLIDFGIRRFLKQFYSK